MSAQTLSFKIDGNVCSLFYVQRKDLNGKAKFTIMLDKGSWKKGGILTAPPIAAHDMYFDKGQAGQYGNTSLIQKTVEVNPGNISLSLQKAKTFGAQTGFGTLPMIAKANTDLVFYWPQDNAGDHFNNFTKIVVDVKNVTTDLVAIATQLAKLKTLKLK